MTLTISSCNMFDMSMLFTARIRSPTRRRPHRSAGLFSMMRPVKRDKVVIVQKVPHRQIGQTRSSLATRTPG